MNDYIIILRAFVWLESELTTLIVAAITGRNNYQFQCVITDAEDNSVISDAVKMTVK